MLCLSNCRNHFQGRFLQIAIIFGLISFSCCSLYSVGQGNYGSLGMWDYNSLRTPKPVPTHWFDGLNNQQILNCAIGYGHSVCVFDDGSVYVTGRSSEGQLCIGYTTAGHFNKFQKVDFNFSTTVGEKAVSVTANYYNTMILTNKGNLWGCGYNYYGALAQGDWSARWSPVLVDVDGKSVVKVASGSHHNLAVTSDDKLYSWGYNRWRALGHSCDSTHHYSSCYNAVEVLPTWDNATYDITSISAGAHTSVVGISNGKFYAMGLDHVGQTGVGPTNYCNQRCDASTTYCCRYSPTEIPISQFEGNTPIEVSMGSSHSLIRTTGDKLYIVGSIPMTVCSDECNSGKCCLTGRSIFSGSVMHSYIAASHEHGYFVDSYKYLWGYGMNSQGQLGSGNTVAQLDSPIKISNYFSGFLPVGEPIRPYAGYFPQGLFLTYYGASHVTRGDCIEEVGCDFILEGLPPNIYSKLYDKDMNALPCSQPGDKSYISSSIGPGIGSPELIAEASFGGNIYHVPISGPPSENLDPLFHYDEAQITSISPNMIETVGETIIISGINLGHGEAINSSEVVVLVNGITCQNPYCPIGEDYYTIVCDAPAGTGTPAVVRVIKDGLISEDTDHLSYQPPLVENVNVEDLSVIRSSVLQFSGFHFGVWKNRISVYLTHEAFTVDSPCYVSSVSQDSLSDFGVITCTLMEEKGAGMMNARVNVDGQVRSFEVMLSKPVVYEVYPKFLFSNTEYIQVIGKNLGFPSTNLSAVAPFIPTLVPLSYVSIGDSEVQPLGIAVHPFPEVCEDCVVMTIDLVNRTNVLLSQNSSFTNVTRDSPVLPQPILFWTPTILQVSLMGISSVPFTLSVGPLIRYPVFFNFLLFFVLVVIFIVVLFIFGVFVVLRLKRYADYNRYELPMQTILKVKDEVVGLPGNRHLNAVRRLMRGPPARGSVRLDPVSLSSDPQFSMQSDEYFDSSGKLVSKSLAKRRIEAPVEAPIASFTTSEVPSQNIKTGAVGAPVVKSAPQHINVADVETVRRQPTSTRSDVTTPSKTKVGASSVSLSKFINEQMGSESMDF